MKKKVVVKIFRFDVKSDYLSYYKPYQLKLEKSATPRDITEAIQKEDALFICDFSHVSHVVVDGIGFGIDEVLGDALKADIRIEPIATDRAKLDFELNEKDFWEKYELLSKWCDESDRDYYESKKAYFYLSGVRKVNSDYIGEAAFLLADRLTKKLPSSELEILEVVADEEDGIWHYGTLLSKFNSLEDDIDETILSLKRRAYDYGLVPQLKKEAFIDKYDGSNESFFGENLGFKSFDSSKLEGLNVAVYIGNYNKKFRHLDVCKLLKDKEVNVVKTNSVNDYCGYESFDLDPSIFDKAASEVVADAYDSNASIILSPWKEVVDLMKSRKSQIEAAAGRDLKIDIIHTSEIS